MRKQKYEELKYYIEELKTLSIKASAEASHFITFNTCDYLLANGKTIKRVEILKNGKAGSAAIILPITKEGNVLLVAQPRVLTESTVGVELPAGYFEVGEDPAVAARRELIEETGYTPERLEFLIKYYQDQGCSRALNHSFLAYNCVKMQAQNLDKDEFIRYFECYYSEFEELISLGYVNDANSILTKRMADTVIKKNF